ncbi:hypothetical protein J4212_06745 [Candidatus Woesearchaeota archaeon]|nr:hypothetical protein [Candidatus Woesearchaeota archaeon]
MDIFAHWLWVYAAFHKKKYAKMAAFFGVLPDLLSFGLFFVVMLFTGGLDFSRRGPPPLDAIPGWVFSSYNWTHSLVIFSAAFILLCLILKKFYWPLLGWAIHILIDIPTHTSRFFPTPFLWPLSSYSYSGISWAAGWFMMLNYSLLVLAYVYIAFSGSVPNLAKARVSSFRPIYVHGKVPAIPVWSNPLASFAGKVEWAHLRLLTYIRDRAAFSRKFKKRGKGHNNDGSIGTGKPEDNKPKKRILTKKRKDSIKAKGV